MKSFEVNWSDKTFVFVHSDTPISLGDAYIYINENYNNYEFEDEAVEGLNSLPQPPKDIYDSIPEEHQRNFMKDYRELGVEFCSDKYGLSKQRIEAEVSRITKSSLKNG